MTTLAEQRERARQLATRIVAAAIGLMGVTLVVLAIVLLARMGAGFLFLSVILILVGGALAFVGFFFQLVPFRLEELAAEKRAYDERRAQERLRR